MANAVDSKNEGLVAQIGHLVRGMRRDHDPSAAFGHAPHDPCKGPEACGVQRAERLIEQHESGVGHVRDGNNEALPHAPGQVGGRPSKNAR